MIRFDGNRIELNKNMNEKFERTLKKEFGIIAERLSIAIVDVAKRVLPLAAVTTCRGTINCMYCN